MEGTVTVTRAGEVSVHTYVAPERGWRAASHLIELPSQLVLFDAQLTLDYARELMGHAAATGKPVTRCYISHAHPDHFAGTTLVDAPIYALTSQKELIDRSGDLRIRRAYQLTPGHEDTALPPARPVDHVAEAGEEVIDGVRLRLQPVLDAETTEQLTIGLPDQRILIAQDVVYHGVHSFIGEHNFASWSAALDQLGSWPYDIVLAADATGSDGGAVGHAGLPEPHRKVSAVAGTSEQTTQSSPARGSGATVKERWAFAAAAASMAVLFMGNSLPSALYGLLRTAFGYSSLTQTLLYAVPVVLVILPGLLVSGTLSDVIGRRAPIVTGLTVFAAGDVRRAAHPRRWIWGCR